MKYSIIYALTNILSDEKISVGLVCLTEKGCTYRYSDNKINLSKSLLTNEQHNYVRLFLTGFSQNFIDGRSTAAILSSLDTLHRYSNNYVIFSPVKELNIPDSLTSPEQLYSELIEK